MTQRFQKADLEGCVPKGKVVRNLLRGVRIIELLISQHAHFSMTYSLKEDRLEYDRCM